MLDENIIVTVIGSNILYAYNSVKNVKMQIELT